MIWSDRGKNQYSDEDGSSKSHGITASSCLLCFLAVDTCCVNEVASALFYATWFALLTRGH